MGCPLRGLGRRHNFGIRRRHHQPTRTGRSVFELVWYRPISTVSTDLHLQRHWSTHSNLILWMIACQKAEADRIFATFAEVVGARKLTRNNTASLIAYGILFEIAELCAREHTGCRPYKLLRTSSRGTDAQPLCKGLRLLQSAYGLSKFHDFRSSLTPSLPKLCCDVAT